MSYLGQTTISMPGSRFSQDQHYSFFLLKRLMYFNINLLMLSYFLCKSTAKSMNKEFKKRHSLRNIGCIMGTVHLPELFKFALCQ